MHQDLICDFWHDVAPRLRGELRRSFAQLGEGVDDIVQSAFAKLIREGPSPSDRTAEGWVFVAARNEALNTVLARKRQKQREISYQRNRNEVTGENPVDVAVHEEEAERIQWACEQLPVELRKLLEMRFSEDLSLRQIAERTNTPLSTVNSRMQKALILLNHEFHKKGTHG